MSDNMDNSMKLFFLIAPCIYAVNFIISILFALKYKDPIYKKNMITWLLYLIFIFTQAILSNQNNLHVIIKMFLWSFTVFIFFTSMSTVIRNIYNNVEKINHYFKIYGFGLAMTVSIYYLTGWKHHSFLPLVIVTAWPLLKLSSLLKNFKSNSFTKNGFLLCAISLALHVIDYAYVYDNPDFIFPGYLIALIISTGISCFSFAALIERAILEIEVKDLLHNTSRLAALGGMAAEIAHEINNPLATIRNTNFNLRKKALDNSVDSEFLLKKLDVYDNMTNRLIKIMDGLKASYRSAENDQFKKTQLSQIIDDVKILCEMKADKAGVDLIFDHNLSNIALECRPVQITQILQNIVNNGIDALEKSELKNINIKCMNMRENFIEIHISDSGPGVSLENREKIFNTLFTTKYDGKGTGLGLSISRRYAEEHQGYLKLSEVQLPTTFILGLPTSQNTQNKT